MINVNLKGLLDIAKGFFGKNKPISALEATAFAAHYLEQYLAKTKKEQEDKDSLASVLTVLACLKPLLNSSGTKLVIAQNALFQPTLTKLEQVLHMRITSDLTPIEIAARKYGKPGVDLFQHLKSLGMNEYSLEFWSVMVQQLEQDNTGYFGAPALCISLA